MSKHTNTVSALLVGVGGGFIGAETNSLTPKIIADFSTLINLLADQGALHNDGELMDVCAWPSAGR